MPRPRLSAIPQPTNRRDGWYRIENKASKDEAEVWIHGEIGGWWDGTSAQEFIDEIKNIRASRLKVHINSPGGSVFDGFAIYTALAEHPATVECRIDGMALSAASYIALAGDEVNIAKTGTMMIHDGQGFALGNAADMRDMADVLDKLSDTIAGTYVDRTGDTAEEWRNRMREETWYNAQEALDAGLVDEIRSKDGKSDDQDAAEAAKVAASWDLSVFRYPGRDKAPAPNLQVMASATIVPSPAVETPADDADPFAALDDAVFASLGETLDDLFDPVDGYDPATLGSLIADVYVNAPAPPAVPPGPARPRADIPIGEFVDAIVAGIQEGVRP